MPKAYSYIRFSSKRQERGSSVERQTAATESFARQHNLELQDVTYSDLGVSAFRGKHARAGALKAFVDAVEARHIERGSWLLVESLDRITREQLAEAQARITTLLSLGITIATIADGQVYKPSARNSLGDAIAILVSLSRSHEESLMKSQRAKGGWVKARKLAAESGTSPPQRGGGLPSWLERTEDGTIQPIPEKAALVQRVFALALDGRGAPAVARQLNEEGHQTFTGKRWTASAVSRLLHRRTVLGYWQPNKTTTSEHGTRVLVPEGEPLLVYPPVIDSGDWHRVQQLKQERRSLTGAAASKECVNVFSGLMRCRCGKPLRYANRKNKTPSLCCRTINEGTDCSYRRSILYPIIEAMVLTALSGLDYSALFPDGKEVMREKKESLESRLASLEAETQRLTRRRQKALDTMLDNENEALEKALRGAVLDAEEALGAAKVEREKATQELADVLRELSRATDTHVSLQGVAAMVQETRGRERVNAALKDQLSSLVLDAQGGTVEATMRHTQRQLDVHFELQTGGKQGSWRVVVNGKETASGAAGYREAGAE
ncbi:Recombinase zinc beta ribbon domain-containing protein [Microbulbifer donghaiensis]|uniref:Recombinase zinc beta ribbon domain-containing protein n=1 Tax=Microbulbifer donghaiensis TaxID=494016 RepID=A0A1M4X5F0_9GAMM|nr:recombinase family protein [Microbulbifer donghaiensis]SHE88699.1 Recombinase zinc beta ribbon domain-containing protein [Microbulbifer donghaiensis]